MAIFIKHKSVRVYDARNDQKRKLDRLLARGWQVDSCHPIGMFLGQAKGMMYHLSKGRKQPVMDANKNIPHAQPPIQYVYPPQYINPQMQQIQGQYNNNVQYPPPNPNMNTGNYPLPPYQINR